MRKITLKGKTIEVPTGLDELTPELYLEYIRLAMMLTAGHISLESWRKTLYSRLAGLKGYEYTLLRDRYRAEADRQLEAVTATFLRDTPDGPVPRFDTCRNLLPRLGDYTGPADWLNDLTFGQFTELVALFETSQDDAAGAYAAMARLLYSIPEGAPVPPELAWHAPVLFGAVWSAIQSGPVEINGRPIDFGIIFRGTGSSRPDDKTGWAGVTFEVASSGVFGNVAEVERAPFWSVLMYLYKCKFEYMHEKRAASK